MKSLAFAGLAIAAAVSFTGCDPKPRGRQEPAPGPQHQAQPRPGSATLPPDGGETKPKTEEVVTTETKPHTGNVIPEPTPRKNPEYGIKIDKQPGYMKSPYDAQGRKIDISGLPPGTEVEDPFTPGRTLLVP